MAEKDFIILLERLKQDYPPSVCLIREKMKEELGFTFRRHREWAKVDGPYGEYDGYGEYVTGIHLDFYNESKKTFFLVKYGEFIK